MAKMNQGGPTSFGGKKLSGATPGMTGIERALMAKAVRRREEKVGIMVEAQLRAERLEPKEKCD
jgi:hypothetical protein